PNVRRRSPRATRNQANTRGMKCATQPSNAGSTGTDSRRQENTMNQDHTLHNLMLDEIRDLYDAEKQLVKALPKMADKASGAGLRQAIAHHLGATQGHVQRLERAFGMLDEKAKGKHCSGIAGIIDEGSDILGSSYEGVVKDAGIIAGAQRAEHYE